MAKEKDVPKSKVGQLMYFIRGMDVFLHPRIIEALEKKVWEARTEMAQEARDQKISRELQELEPLLELYRRDIVNYTKGGAPVRHLWHLRPVFAKIIELYGKQTENEQ